MDQKETLTKFRLKNFRSFADTGDIEIKPINFLVGANSSGKSSILKFFPLLKQSMRNRPFNGVFRWLSNDVDFRDFGNTVRFNETDIVVALDFYEKTRVTFDIIQDKELFDKFKSISVLQNEKILCNLEEGDLQKIEKSTYFFPYLLNNKSYENMLLTYASRIILHLAQNIRYIKPIRANIDRYYRLRNDNIEEIASDGSNLSMFLYSLSDERFTSYTIFLYKNFGFKVEIKKSEGNIEILISEKDSLSRNAVDMGYGYTELLPILTTIWLECTKNSNSLIVIEQPEVHLHPKFQAKFAKMLCKVIKNYPDIRFFIETHSETILNTIGNEIDYKRAKAEDINVLLIEKNNGISTVKSTGYDNDGYLKDWPANFLDEDADYN